MKNKSLKHTLLVFLFGILLACGESVETPEETLKKLGIDQAGFSQLSECKQVNIWAEVGYNHLDITMERWWVGQVGCMMK